MLKWCGLSTYTEILAFSTLTWGGAFLSYSIWLVSWSIVCGFSCSNNRHLTDKMDFPPQIKYEACHSKGSRDLGLFLVLSNQTSSKVHHVVSAEFLRVYFVLDISYLMCQPWIFTSCALWFKGFWSCKHTPVFPCRFLQGSLLWPWLNFMFRLLLK